MINADDEVSLAYLISPTFQVENTEGRPLTGGYIEVYLHGTRTKYYCYSDWNGSLHPFKIPLDSLGANIVLASPAHSYDIYIYNKFGTLVMSRYNIVPSTGDGAVIKDVVTIKSDDNTVSVTSSDQTNWNLSIKDTVDRVEHNEQEISNVKVDVDNVKTDLTNLTEVVNGHTIEIGQIKEDVAGIESSLTNKKDKQPTKTFNGSATKTVKNITQNDNGELTVEYEDIDLPQEVPNVEITSEDKSIKVTETTDVQTNTKKFDLSVNVNDPLEYGQFRATNVTSQAQLTKIKGNLDVNNYAIKLKKGNSYHFTVRGSYVADSAVNIATTISYIEYSSFTNINVNVDNTVTDPQYFEISYDVYNYSQNGNYNVSFSSITGGKVSELWVEVHNLNGISVNGQGGGSGDNDKVAVDANAEPNYLENVLVSDSDIVSLVKLGNVLHVQVNTDIIATNEYVDAKVELEAQARNKEDELIRSSIPTKTSQLLNDIGFLNTNRIVSDRTNLHVKILDKYYNYIEHVKLESRSSGKIDNNLHIALFSPILNVTSSFYLDFEESDGVGYRDWPAIGYFEIPNFTADVSITVNTIITYSNTYIKCQLVCNKDSNKFGICLESDKRVNSGWYESLGTMLMF